VRAGHGAQVTTLVAVRSQILDHSAVLHRSGAEGIAERQGTQRQHRFRDTVGRQSVKGAGGVGFGHSKAVQEVPQTDGQQFHVEPVPVVELRLRRPHPGLGQRQRVGPQQRGRPPVQVVLHGRRAKRGEHWTEATVSPRSRQGWMP
jgi:hypothetical protein